ncbi:MAG: type VI secretion system tip protein VgrG [Alcaligenaceae bacterium]|nr:type VI secretion system tip protein VgrG [Alcaligenaceae bacterium]
MAESLGNEPRFKFSSDGQGSATLDVASLFGTESISKPFRFELTLISSSTELDFTKILGKSATLNILSVDGSKQIPYHGIVSELEQANPLRGAAVYRAVLVPNLWQLSLTKTNELYGNEQTIPQIIETVLKANNLTSLDYQLSLMNPTQYRQRSFVCQYQETSLTFVQRWLESEGLYYYFDHDNSGAKTAKLMILDYKQAEPAATLSLVYAQKEDLQTAMQDDCVFDFTCTQTMLPKTVLVQDYNYRKASLGDQLQATAAASATGQGTVMYFGDNLRTTNDATYLAKVRSEEILCREQVFAGEATAVGLRSGYKIQLSKHYRSSFNGTYLVTDVEHRGALAGVLFSGDRDISTTEAAGIVYECKFKAISSSKQFRAARVTPVPTIAGLMSATVDDEGDGKYAQLNEYGQYKVQLLYDQTTKQPNKGSCWVRLATPYAGAKNGLHFPLLKGSEVMLAFMHGDPDQPMIIGAVSNSENKNVITNQNATSAGILTPSTNMLSVSDLAGDESMCFYSPQGGATIIIGSFEGSSSDK